LWHKNIKTVPGVVATRYSAGKRGIYIIEYDRRPAGTHPAKAKVTPSATAIGASLLLQPAKTQKPNRKIITFFIFHMNRIK
jgi:hypothetical protein